MLPAKLCEQLQHQRTLNRVGVFLIPTDHSSLISMLGAQLGFSEVDLIDIVLSDVSKESRYIGLNPTMFLSLLDSIADRAFDRRTVFLMHFDVLLAQLTDRDRSHTWSELRESFRRRPTSLAIAIPENAEHLFLHSERVRWQQANMLASFAMDSKYSPFSLNDDGFSIG